jgi:hypothetical protein
MTKKARIINKLTTLSAGEKEKAIAFFTGHPNYESHIDWNRKNLTRGDFKKVFAKAAMSKKEQKRKAKADPALLFEKQNCRIIEQTTEYIIVTPLDWKCAKFFNSFDCGGEGARWCIGDRRKYAHWNHYVNDGNIFYLVYFTKKFSWYGRKMLIQYDSSELIAWTKYDEPVDVLPHCNFCREKEIGRQLFFDFDVFENLASDMNVDCVHCNMWRNIFQSIDNDIKLLHAEKLPQKYKLQRRYKRNYEQKSIEDLFKLIERNKIKMGWTSKFFRETIEIASRIYDLGNDEEKKRIYKLIDSLDKEYKDAKKEQI